MRERRRTSDHVFAGELNRRVEFYTEEYINSDTSERISVEKLVFSKMVKRIDGTGSEMEEGMLVPQKTVRYIMRFDPAVLRDGQKWYVKDIDGNFHVEHIAIYGPGRNRFLELKCKMRGEG